MNLKRANTKECPERKKIKARHEKFREFLKNIQNNNTDPKQGSLDLPEKLNNVLLPVFVEKR